MALQTAALNAGVDGLGTITVQLSIHTGDPGPSGTANEVSGGGYVRKTISFAASSGGIKIANALPIAFDGPPSSPATHIGVWTSGGATFLGGQAATGDQAFNALGDLNVSNLRLIALAVV
jgi:hypothetical protein